MEILPVVKQLLQRITTNPKDTAKPASASASAKKADSIAISAESLKKLNDNKLQTDLREKYDGLDVREDVVDSVRQQIHDKKYAPTADKVISSAARTSAEEKMPRPGRG